MPKKKKKAVVNAELVEKICTMSVLAGINGLSTYAKSNNICSLVGCSNTTVQRVLEASDATNNSTDWKVVLDKYKELIDEKQLIKMYKDEGEDMSTNVITIEKNIPIPKPNREGTKGPNDKYKFITKLEVGDSFEVNGNMPDYTPKGIRAKVYEHCKELGMTVTIRTLKGTSDKPEKIRVWRVA